MGSNPDPTPLPFWQVNVAPQHREAACPQYLQNLSAKDIAIIGTLDADYREQTWAEVAAIVRAGRLQDFGRRPSDLRRYREFVWRLQRECGSVMAYMLRERLRWGGEGEEQQQPLGSGPFECEADFRVLFNDWPYGLDPRIVHLVVWTKFELADDGETEAVVEGFVERTFLTGGITRDKVSDGSAGRKLSMYMGTDVITSSSAGSRTRPRSNLFMRSSTST